MNTDQIKSRIFVILKHSLPDLEYDNASIFCRTSSPSLDRVILSSELEQAFSIQFTVEEISSPHFESIDGLTSLIQKKLSSNR